MKRAIIPVGCFALLSLSLFLKMEYEVDYFSEERAEIAELNPSDYFGESSFKFQALAEPGQFIGINGGCLVTLGVSSRDGDSDAVFEENYRQPGTEIKFLYRGVITSQPSYLRAQFDHYVEMTKVAIGGRPKPNLMLHLAVADTCRPSDFLPLTWG